MRGPWKTGIGIFAGIFLPAFCWGDEAAKQPESLRPFLSAYCVSCHGPEKQKGDRRFDGLAFDLTDHDTLLHWQDILDQINLGEMPPEDEKQPQPGELKKIVSLLTGEIELAYTKLNDNGGETVLRRLNRREYLNTIRDLFGFDMTMFDPTDSFPKDDGHDGFDNLGETLVTSGYLLEHYLEAADRIIEKAIVEGPKPESRNWRMKAPFDRTTDAHSAWVSQERRRAKGEYQSIFQGTKERFGYRPLDDIKDGVPHDGVYRIRIKACGLHREHDYDPQLIGTDQDEPIKLALVSGSQSYGTLHLRQSIERTLAVFDLPDDEPEWMEARIWLDAGFQPRMTYRNGPYFFKVLPAPIHKRYPDKFPIKLVYSNWWDVTQNIRTPQIRVFEVEMEGPIHEVWPPRSHRAIFGDLPFSPERTEKILRSFATKAFRRPATETELRPLLSLVESRKAMGDTPLKALKAGLKAVLCSPAFLYLEPETAGESENQLSDYAVASRLSYFLWSSMPDAELLDLAARGALTQPETLRAQTDRMLKDPKARAFAANFTDRWLHLYKLGEMPPDTAQFKNYYVGELEGAMREETHLFFQHLIEENLDIELLLDSDFTFANRPLARHYGIDPAPFKGGLGWVRENGFQKVALKPADRRGGLLGHASVLTATANGIDTSPVIRGIWVLENILGTPPPPPPPDVEPLEPDIRGATTIREQLQKHRDVETCAECHRKIDPIGFALEHFDAIGGYRERYWIRQGKPSVDASGRLPDGEEFQDIDSLRELLLLKKDQFAKCLSEKLLVYATGRKLTFLDRPAIDETVRELDRAGSGLRDLVHLTVQSKAFRSK